MEPVSIQLLESIAKDKDASSLMASLFQTVTNDMKSSQPVWEDFAKQAGKLHACLRNTLVVVSSYLDAFQRVADMSAGTKGASKDIGTALTRICLRHRAVEVKVRECASTLMDSMIVPLQEKMEDWRKYTAHLEKEHAKEYRRHRAELKKRSAEALKQQKKAHKLKSPEARRSLDLLLSDVQDRYQRLETCERGSLEAALVEERRRYCRFVSWLLPFVRGEVAAADEVFRLTEILDQLETSTAEPSVLPQAAEQMLADLKRSADAGGSGSPPRSPLSPRAASSLGSRQSSLCSISSLQSSSSGGAPPPPAGRPRSASQAAAGWLPPAAPAHRVASVSSHDSGFTSQDTLFVRPATPPAAGPEPPEEEAAAAGEMPSPAAEEQQWSPPPPPPESPPPPPPPPPETEAPPPPRQRPHTISSGFVRGGVLQRAPLNTTTFVPPAPAPVAGRPPVPSKARIKQKQRKVVSHYANPADIALPDYHQAAPHMVVPQPVYANMAELREMAALKEEAAAPAPDGGHAGPFCGQPCERCESDGSASSGYDSVHTAVHAPPTDALPPPPDFVLYNFCEERSNGSENKRPMSIAVPPEPARSRQPGLRRSQSQLSCPPPPPVRRESAAGPRPLSLSGPGRAPLSMPAAAAAATGSPPESPVALRRAAASRDPDFLQSLSARLSARRSSERAPPPGQAPGGPPGASPPLRQPAEIAPPPPPPPPPPPETGPRPAEHATLQRRL